MQAQKVGGRLLFFTDYTPAVKVEGDRDLKLDVFNNLFGFWINNILLYLTIYLQMCDCSSIITGEPIIPQIEPIINQS